MVAAFSIAGFSASQISLILQVVVLVGLGVVGLLPRRKKIIEHAWLMLVLMVIHLFSVLFVMLPVTFVIFSSSMPFTWFSIFLAFHVILGLLVFGIGFMLFVNWGFKGVSPICFLNKQRMRYLAVYWVLELIYGFAIYGILYT